jgi:hypothetical protein
MMCAGRLTFDYVNLAHLLGLFTRNIIFFLPHGVVRHHATRDRISLNSVAWCCSYSAERHKNLVPCKQTFHRPHHQKGPRSGCDDTTLAELQSAKAAEAETIRKKILSFKIKPKASLASIRFLKQKTRLERVFLSFKIYPEKRSSFLSSKSDQIQSSQRNVVVVVHFATYT